MGVLEWTGLSAGIGGAVAVRYAVFAGVAWLVAYLWFRRRWFHRKVIQRLPTSADIRREIAHSLRSAVVFGVVGTATVWAARRGWTQMYWDLGERPAWWFCASIGLTVLLHDTWFYWTHRLMHHPRVFRRVHLDHHRSTNPTPWAAFAFSPSEAAVQAAIFPLAVTVMPLHPLAFAAFMSCQMFFNVLGHTGFEVFPQRFMHSPFRFVLNTPTNHAMHHQTMGGNYGLYFNFWDRLMGTNHATYERRFDEVTGRPRDASRPTGAPVAPGGMATDGRD
jgi:sterol desaturase/sphingolipid hydroxylase (fatty acid hydroxylase superfamily)